MLALGWTDPDVEDASINVCVGDDIVIPWNVTLDAGETIDDAKWYYRGDHSEEMIAFMADDQFIVTAPFSRRVQLHSNANAGLVVKTAGLGDRGNYSVEVIIRQAGRDVASMFGHADVLISGMNIVAVILFLALHLLLRRLLSLSISLRLSVYLCLSLSKPDCLPGKR